MTLPISDHKKCYFLTSKLNHESEFKTIVQGCNVYSINSNKKAKTWCIDFFDKVAAYQRTITLKEYPKIEAKNISCISDDGISYHFQIITQQVYEQEVKKLLPKAPQLTQEEDIQKYISRLNPYV